MYDFINCPTIFKRNVISAVLENNKNKDQQNFSKKVSNHFMILKN